MQAMEVRRDNPGATRLVEDSPPVLEAGQALLRVDAFSLTANNVTYAVAGEMLKYWDFFPAGTDGWGRVPVWGFADVVESHADGVEVGQRYYGYYPMGSHLVVEPAKVDAGGFIDGAAHRKHLNSIYNHYSNSETDAIYDAAMEDWIMLFRPLFSTSFLIEDFLADNDFFGADQIVISSASAKTALGTASVLIRSQAETGRQVIGLTSAGNKAFVQGLGYYDAVLTYEEVAVLDESRQTVFVDIAGSASVRSSVHHHFADKLTYSCAVGASHWSEFAPTGALPGAEPQMFFAPAQANKRSSEWGAAGLQAKIAGAWADFIVNAHGWLDIREVGGLQHLEQEWKALIAGHANPKEGVIISLREQA